MEIINSIIVSVVTSVTTTIIVSICCPRISLWRKSSKQQNYQSSAKSAANNILTQSSNYIEEKPPKGTIISLPEKSKNIDIKAHSKQQQQQKCSKKEAAKECKAPITQKKIISKIKCPPSNVEFTYFTVADGKLIVALQGKASYYRSWEINGQRYYQFFCDKNIVKKAINNHSSVIDPFCVKSNDSVDYDFASYVETDECGLLDGNNNIKKKTILNIK